MFGFSLCRSIFSRNYSTFQRQIEKLTKCARCTRARVHIEMEEENKKERPDYFRRRFLSKAADEWKKINIYRMGRNESECDSFRAELCA